MIFYQKGYLHYILIATMGFMLWQFYFLEGEEKFRFVLALSILFIFFSILSSYRLTLEFTDNALIFKAGIGVIKKVIPYSCIESSTVQSQRFWTGIGIRFIGNGWLYNIKMGTAVEIKLKDKTMVTQLGFDQAEEIVQEIRRRISKNGTN